MTAGVDNPSKRDLKTGVVRVIDYAHSEVHSGDHFFACDVQTNKTAYIWTFTAPNTLKWCHFMMDLAATGAGSFTLYETSTRAGGAAVTAYNSDRNSATAAGLTLTTGDAGGAAGTRLWSGWVSSAGGAPRRAGGSSSQREDEIILKQGTKYGIEWASASGQDLYFNPTWYEHTNNE